MKLTYYTLISILLLTVSCQSDDEQFPVSMVFGDWVAEGGREGIILSNDYTYVRHEAIKSGFTGMSGDWSYRDSRIVFLNGKSGAMIYDPLDSVRVTLRNPPNGAQVISVTQGLLELEFYHQHPGSYYRKDTTIVYIRRD